MSDTAACDACDGVGLHFNVKAKGTCATVRRCEKCDGMGRTGFPVLPGTPASRIPKQLELREGGFEWPGLRRW